MVIRDDHRDKGMFCLFDIYPFHAASGCFLPRWGWCTSDIEWLYWESKKGLSSSVFFPVWWGLVLAPGRDNLTSWPMVSFASRATLIASSFEMGSQWMGAWMGLTCGSSSRSTGGLRRPRPWKSEVQFLEMNSRVQVPCAGQTRSADSGGGGRGPAADSWWLSGSVGGGRGGLLMEHFLMKSACRVSTSSAMLASVLSKLVGQCKWLGRWGYSWIYLYWLEG